MRIDRQQKEHAFTRKAALPQTFVQLNYDGACFRSNQIDETNPGSVQVALKLYRWRCNAMILDRARLVSTIMLCFHAASRGSWRGRGDLRAGEGRKRVRW